MSKRTISNIRQKKDFIAYVFLLLMSLNVVSTTFLQARNPVENRQVKHPKQIEDIQLDDKQVAQGESDFAQIQKLYGPVISEGLILEVENKKERQKHNKEIEEQNQKKWFFQRKRDDFEYPELNEFSKLSILYQLFDTLPKNQNPYGCRIKEAVFQDLEVFSGRDSSENYLLKNIENKCSTSMGKSQLQKLFFNPTTDVNKLRERQELLKLLIENEELFENIEKVLNNISQSENGMLSFWKETDEVTQKLFDDQYFKNRFFRWINKHENLLEINALWTIFGSPTWALFWPVLLPIKFMTSGAFFLKYSGCFFLDKLGYLGDKEMFISFKNFVSKGFDLLNKGDTNSAINILMVLLIGEGVPFDIIKTFANFLKNNLSNVKDIFEAIHNSTCMKDVCNNAVVKGILTLAFGTSDNIGMVGGILNTGINIGINIPNYLYKSFSEIWTPEYIPTFFKVYLSGVGALFLLGNAISIKNSFEIAIDFNKYTKDMQKRLIDVGTFVAAGQEILSKIYGEQRSLFESVFEIDPMQNVFSTSNENPEAEKFLEKMLSSTFQGNPRFLCHKGRVLAAFKKMLNPDMRNSLVGMMEGIGKLDAYMSLARYYKKHANHPKAPLCFVEYIENVEKPSINLESYWNPLLKQDIAVVNDIELGNKINGPCNMIVTGPNAGGKSTNLKSICINCLMAQTCGFAFAKSMRMTPFTIINTYLNIADTIGKESLFQAEITRIKSYFEELQSMKNGFVLSIMDELFTGTNPKEGSQASFGAAKKLLQYPNSINIIATHFINSEGHMKDMTKLETETDGLFKNFYVEINRHKDGLFNYTYKLLPGISNERIGLELIEKAGLDFSNEYQPKFFNG
jgi:hypothetical protein